MSNSTIKEVQGTPSVPRTRYRNDIQGLRAIAVVVVLLFHANAPFLPGGFIGVDVFFVISGFLISGILIREAEKSGRINLLEFYAKRIRRILPAATVVLVTTAVLTFAFLPGIRWQGIGIETIAASVYVVNWLFAANTDYLNAEVAASPLQHFWTLAVEEQFYIVWPLIITAILIVGVRFFSSTDRLRWLAMLLPWGVLLLFIPSMIWSVIYTSSDPAPAYFSTGTRVWEMAVGAIVAVYARKFELIPRWLGRMLGWAGLLGILLGSILYNSETPFPGVAALLPTCAAAAIIIGGMAGRDSDGAGRLLSARPMRWIGGISYSLYLWHWPLIVIATYLVDGSLSFKIGLLVVAFSFLPAWVSYRFIEGPFRDWELLKKNISTALKAGGLLVTISIAAGLILLLGSNLAQTSSVAKTDALGAMSLHAKASSGTSEHGDSAVFVPTPNDAREDNPVIYESGCHADQGFTEHPGCVLGDSDGEVSVALVGDSHAASWVPALQKIAERHHWKLQVYTKSACGFADVEMAQGADGRYAACTEWNHQVMDQLTHDQPDLVITSNSMIRKIWDQRVLTEEQSILPFSEGLQRSWGSLNSAGIPVVVIRDVPRMRIDIPECVSAHPNDLEMCAVPRSEAIDEQPRSDQIAQRGMDMTVLIDMNDWICPEQKCAPVIGNVLVWRDGHHLTATYSATLADPLEEALKEAKASREIFPQSDE